MKPKIQFSDRNFTEAGARFVEWLSKRIEARATGADKTSQKEKPSDRVWLGRLAPVGVSAGTGRDSRLERMEPCAIGLRVLPISAGPWNVEVQFSFFVWAKDDQKSWQKTGPVVVIANITIPAQPTELSAGSSEFARATSAAGLANVGGEFQVATEQSPAGLVVTITAVNTSQEVEGLDQRFYEAELKLSGLKTRSFLLDAIEETFRHDREVEAYGINCGIIKEGSTFRTIDLPAVDKMRPLFWGSEESEVTLTFNEVAENPTGKGAELVAALKNWGQSAWSHGQLTRRAKDEGWSPGMLKNAQEASGRFDKEVGRIEEGIRLLNSNLSLSRAFKAMNQAMAQLATRRAYKSWRPFQFGFLLANLKAILGDAEERNTVDIVWFATGGGKTETYLGLLITSAFYDRLTGKAEGITAWSRFPLRLLSLQQMQRFADAMAAAEIVRRDHDITGAPFSVGFLVGDDATPNRVRRPEQKEGSRYDPDDPTLPKRFRMLQRCPFCQNENLTMAFNTAVWRLEHRCDSEECSWPVKALPFYIVDEEVFRFLPTVIVGTLDKAASIGMQQAMRGLVGAPRGVCSNAGHGFTYNLSGTSPTGCLVPDCKGQVLPLPIEPEKFAPAFRLQDELHLLRDSLGAVDAHYEAVLDGIQAQTSGLPPKILASSATLSGYSKQCEVLYRRSARVFPEPGPSPNEGFWSKPSNNLMRSFKAIAPRGATLEFAVDRLISELQIAIRELVTSPTEICGELNIDEQYADFLVTNYGTNVVYGNTLRDLDAVIRSSSTQLVGVQGPIRNVSLTGRTQFEQVSQTLDDLQKHDEKKPFHERIHIVTASSMMSHGVDIDRLNVMIMLGLPLSAAEFIQATARVGRQWPGIVFVVHKMGRERDASIYRLFEKFVEQGDRFVEPIPITKRSRRVLERTISGLEMARLLHLHAPTFAGRFTTVQAVRHSLQVGEIVPKIEKDALCDYLEFDPTTEEDHRNDVDAALERYFDKVNSPSEPGYTWYGKVWTKKPMTSLRDVEELVPVHLVRDV